MTPAKPKTQSHDWVKIQDRLDDFMVGFEFWKKEKISSAGLTTVDEMLIRWVDASPERWGE